MVKDTMTLSEAMSILGIRDIRMSHEEAKKIYKGLLKKWHPDMAPSGKEDLYNDKTAEINAAYDVVEKAYNDGRLGPNVASSTSSTSSTNKNTGSYYTYWQNTYNNRSNQSRSKSSETSQHNSQSNKSSQSSHTSNNTAGTTKKSTHTNNTDTPPKKKEPLFKGIIYSVFDRSLISLLVLFSVFALVEILSFNNMLTSKDQEWAAVLPYLVEMIIALLLGYVSFKKVTSYTDNVIVSAIVAIIVISISDSVFRKALSFLNRVSFLLYTLVFYGLWAKIEYTINIPKILNAKKNGTNSEKLYAKILLAEYAIVFCGAILTLIFSFFI